MKENIFFKIVVALCVLLLTFVYVFIDNKVYFSSLFLFFLFLCFIYLILKYKLILVFYLKEVKTEYVNITWPSKSDVKNSTLMVMLIVFFTSCVIWLIDSIFTYLISKFI